MYQVEGDNLGSSVSLIDSSLSLVDVMDLTVTEIGLCLLHVIVFRSDELFPVTRRSILE